MQNSILKPLWHIVFILAVACGLHYGFAAPADAPQAPDKILAIEEFIVQAVRNDTVFEEILIEELKLKYAKALNIPAGDILLSVKSRYNFLLSLDKERADLSVGLERLFPYSGTTVSATYSNTPALSSGIMGSEFNALISQPIAQNAFGHATRLYDKIIGLETEVSRFQIVEAYEDYLAALIVAYYDWYSAYEDLKISESSYQENNKLLDNMLERAKQKIALPVDVNKVRLLVLTKEERLVRARETYDNLTNIIKKAVRYDGSDKLKPADPFNYQHRDIDFDRDYRSFMESSRTYEILTLLENKSSLEVKKSANDLLPSTNLLIGYKVEGDKWQMEDKNKLFYAGISLDWPFWNQEGQAVHEVALIDQRKREVMNQNKYIQLYTDLKNIYAQIQREQILIRLSEEKILLAESVLKDEARNYSYGKISLNDYINAVNDLDINRFSRTTHFVQLHKLITEWRRLTDRLVDQNVLKSAQPH
jgi:outer membrane protein TolC